MKKHLYSKKTQKKIWIFLIVCALPPFILWGSGSLLEGKAEKYHAGRIFGRRIPMPEYQEALDAVRVQAIIRFGENLPKVEKFLNLQSQAWERLVMLAEARRRKIRTQDKEIVDQVAAFPFFQKKGKFDEGTYEQVLRYYFRVQPRAFEEQLRQNISIVKLYQQVTSAVTVNEKELSEEYRRANEQISIFYIAGVFADFAKGITLDEAKLRDYFAAHQEEFREPLSFNIEYFSAAVEDNLPKIYQRLNKKEEMKKVAADFGCTVKESGFFNQSQAIPGIGWAPQVTAMIAAARTDDLFSPVYIDKIYYIIKLKARRAPYIPRLENIQEKVKDAAVKEQAKIATREKMQECLKTLKEDTAAGAIPVDFEGTAKNLGLKYGSTVNFNYGSYIEGIGASDEFWKAAQEIKGQESSNILETPLGLYIIRVKSRQEIDPKKFNAEKAAFRQKLLLAKQEAEFSRFLDGLKSRASR